LIHPNFNPPRRGDTPRTSTTFQSYATALANLGNPQDDATPTGGIAPPPRPPKRNVQMVYDLQGEFPNLPKRNNQNQTAQKAANPTQNHNITTTNENTHRKTPPVTPDNLSQLRTDMTNDFMAMIQKEVKKQIQNEMAAIQQEMANLGNKIDNMQVEIKTNIGTAIRESIRDSFPQPQAQAPTQQYYQPAGRQPASHMHSTQNNYSSPSASMNYQTPNYYEPLQTEGPPQDGQMQQFNPNSTDNTTQDTNMCPSTEGTSPMETGAQK
jgi:hypothetical protein